MSRSPRDPPAAAVDIGTNSTLLLVGRRDGERIVVLEDSVRMPRLGEGIARSGRLSGAAVERTLDVLAEFARRMSAHAVPERRRRAVATAVLRAVSDAADFQRLALERCGLAVEVLAGAEEARLGWTAAFGRRTRDAAVLVDVGGGSSEVAWGAGTRRTSIPLGAVVLAERFGADLDLARAHAREACLALPEGVARGCDVVLLGGSGVNLAALELGLARFDPAATDGAAVTAAAAATWAARLGELTPEQRAALPIEAERAAILPAGLIVVGAVLERLAAGAARVSGKGLRYGVLLELLGAQGPENFDGSRDPRGTAIENPPGLASGPSALG